MKSVEQLVFSLLQTNECVVIPSFGGFIVKVKSAHLDYTRGIALPPSKNVSFNIKLQNNDGQLIKHCSSENNLSYPESEHFVKDRVVEWQQTIDQGNRLQLEHIGVFWKDAEHNIQFEQDRSVNLLLHSYGLELVEFIPAIQAVAPDKPSIIELPRSSNRKRLLRYAAAAAVVLPLAFYSVWIPVKTPAFESGLISYHDFNFMEQPRTAEYSYKQLRFSPLDATLQEFPLIQPDSLATVEERPLTPMEDKRVQEPFIQATSMHLIAGCFSNNDNAERFQNKLRSMGFEAKTLRQGGLYKVSIGSGLSEESLQNIKMKAQEASIDAWVLK